MQLSVPPVATHELWQKAYSKGKPFLAGGVCYLVTLVAHTLIGNSMAPATSRWVSVGCGAIAYLGQSYSLRFAVRLCFARITQAFRLISSEDYQTIKDDVVRTYRGQISKG